MGFFCPMGPMNLKRIPCQSKRELSETWGFARTAGNIRNIKSSECLFGTSATAGEFNLKSFDCHGNNKSSHALCESLFLFFQTVLSFVPVFLDTQTIFLPKSKKTAETTKAKDIK